MANDASEQVRLQIPVSKALGEAISKIAEELERSQTWVAGKLLRVAMSDLEVVGGWLRRRAIGHGEARRMGWLQMGDSSEMRLQVPVSPELLKSIEELAARLNHTPVRMAALLLDFSIDDNRFLLKVFSTKLGKMLTDRLWGKRTEAES